MDLQLWWTGEKGRKNSKRKITNGDGVFWFGRKLRFLLRNFKEEFQNSKNMERLKLRKDGLIKIEIEKKNQVKTKGELLWKKEF